MIEVCKAKHNGGSCPNFREYLDKEGKFDLKKYSDAHPSKPIEFDGEGVSWNRFLSLSAKNAKRHHSGEGNDSRPKTSRYGNQLSPFS